MLHQMGEGPAAVPVCQLSATDCSASLTLSKSIHQCQQCQQTVVSASEPLPHGVAAQPVVQQTSKRFL